MWSNDQSSSMPSMYGHYGAAQNQQQQQQQQQQKQKHDIFVGNLSFSTTEEQIHQAFSELGPIIKVRMVLDLETGKPRGFAFVEFENAQDALSAIRNMNDYELNGRKIRVNFSNSSHLETLAEQLGMDMTQKTKNIIPGSAASGAGSGGATGGTSNTTANNVSSNANSTSDVGTQAVANALKSMPKGEMYDIIAKLKDIADNDPDEARKIISGHPQLPEAILYLMSQLDMIKTPMNTSVMGVTPPTIAVAGATAVPLAVSLPTMDNATSNPPIRMDPRSMVTDPRSAAKNNGTNIPPPPVPVPIDPRALAVDPRKRADPRLAQQQNPLHSSSIPPPPPQTMFMHGQPQQHQPPPPPPMAVAGLDQQLVQQVMALTPAQIAQLPVDKQTSIMALRQQIQNAMGGVP